MNRNIRELTVLAGEEGFARLRAGRVAALGRPRRPIHCRSHQSRLYFKKQTERLSDVRSVLAGEEGFEPSAYGFGDRRSTS